MFLHVGLGNPGSEHKLNRHNIGFMAIDHLLHFYQINDNYKKKFNDEKNVPRPPHWSGWRLLPDEIEFWLDGEGRIHERLNYKKSSGKWEKELLYP